MASNDGEIPIRTPQPPGDDHVDPRADPRAEPWTMTPRQLAAALVQGDRLDDEPVEIVVVDMDGNEICDGLMYMTVGTGQDMDHSGTYQWRRIVARMDSSTRGPRDPGESDEIIGTDSAEGPF